MTVTVSSAVPRPWWQYTGQHQEYHERGWPEDHEAAASFERVEAGGLVFTSPSGVDVVVVMLLKRSVVGRWAILATSPATVAGVGRSKFTTKFQLSNKMRIELAFVHT
jgi:hypothetical protein